MQLNIHAPRGSALYDDVPNPARATGTSLTLQHQLTYDKTLRLLLVVRQFRKLSTALVETLVLSQAFLAALRGR